MDSDVGVSGGATAVAATPPVEAAEAHADQGGSVDQGGHADQGGKATLDPQSPAASASASASPAPLRRTPQSLTIKKKRTVSPVTQTPSPLSASSTTGRPKSTVTASSASSATSPAPRNSLAASRNFLSFDSVRSAASLHANYNNNNKADTPAILVNNNNHNIQNIQNNGNHTQNVGNANGDAHEGDASRPASPAAAASIFPLFLAQGRAAAAAAAAAAGGAALAARNAPMSSYMFRSMSNVSLASLDSAAGTGSNSDINSFTSDSPAAHIAPSSAISSTPSTAISSTTSTATLKTTMNAEDDEDAMLLARLDQHARQGTGNLTLRTPAGQHTTTTAKWIAGQIQASFNSVRESVISGAAAAAASASSSIAAGTGSGPDATTDADPDAIDWDFWGKVINDYEGQLRQYPRQFTQKLHRGIPEPIRGMMWQLMSNSKSESLEEEYLQILTRHTRHEKVIQRDLARTFPAHPYFKTENGPGQTALFNILKAYSIYDQEIGYCQGIAFIVGPLLLNMPEEQAFCVLVRLMNDYGFRDLFSPKMVGLQLRNYQFDKLIEEQFPAVYRHLVNQDIKSTMYASQWFMTLFAYRFPLDMVFRIMDIVLAEGAESVLRFAIALIQHNADAILAKDFEPLLEFLKSGLFDQYISNINQLVAHASIVRLPKHKLEKWTKEFHQIMRKQSPEVMEAETARAETRKLLDAYRLLETNYDTLNRDHITLANQLVSQQVDAEKSADTIEQLTSQITSLKTLVADDRRYAEDAVRSDMSALVTKNNELSRANAALQEEVGDLETQLADAKLRLATSLAENDELRRKLDTMRRALAS